MKMPKFLVFALIAILALTVRANPISASPVVLISHIEDQCVRQGGWCVFKNECPLDRLPSFSDSLCPQQKHLGVTCCYV